MRSQVAAAPASLNIAASSSCRPTSASGAQQNLAKILMDRAIVIDDQDSGRIDHVQSTSPARCAETEIIGTAERNLNARERAFRIVTSGPLCRFRLMGPLDRVFDISMV